MLSTLEELTPMRNLEKYRLNFNIDENQEGSQLNQYKKNIIDFEKLINKAIPQMEKQTH